jgi:hypothetical protein
MVTRTQASGGKASRVLDTRELSGHLELAHLTASTSGIHAHCRTRIVFLIVTQFSRKTVNIRSAGKQGRSLSVRHNGHVGGAVYGAEKGQEVARAPIFAVDEAHVMMLHRQPCLVDPARKS